MAGDDKGVVGFDRLQSLFGQLAEYAVRTDPRDYLEWLKMHEEGKAGSAASEVPPTGEDGGDSFAADEISRAFWMNVASAVARGATGFWGWIARMAGFAADADPRAVMARVRAERPPVLAALSAEVIATWNEPLKGPRPGETIAAAEIEDASRYFLNERGREAAVHQSDSNLFGERDRLWVIVQSNLMSARFDVDAAVIVYQAAKQRPDVFDSLEPLFAASRSDLLEGVTNSEYFLFLAIRQLARLRPELFDSSRIPIDVFEDWVARRFFTPEDAESLLDAGHGEAAIAAVLRKLLLGVGETGFARIYKEGWVRIAERLGLLGGPEHPNEGGSRSGGSAGGSAPANGGTGTTSTPTSGRGAAARASFAGLVDVAEGPSPAVSIAAPEVDAEIPVIEGAELCSQPGTEVVPMAVVPLVAVPLAPVR